MGKSLTQRLQTLFCNYPSQTKRAEPIIYSPSYLQRNILYCTAESVASIKALSGINVASVCGVTRPRPYGLEEDNFNRVRELSPFQRLFSRFGLERNQKPIKDVIVRGSMAQDSIGPFVTNSQCTTMAYQSLIYKAYRGLPDTWTSGDIDAILRLGHRQHTQFRFVDKLSTHWDGKVGVYQLPDIYEVQPLSMFSSGSMAYDVSSLKGIKIKRVSEKDGCYHYPSSEMAKEMSYVAPEFPLFMAETFKKNDTAGVNMVLTIGEFSMAVWREEGGSRLWLFDSHRRGPTGGAHCPSEPGAALVRSFCDLDSLMAHLVGLAGTDFVYSAALFNIDVGQAVFSINGTHECPMIVEKEGDPDAHSNSTHKGRFSGFFSRFWGKKKRNCLHRWKDVCNYNAAYQTGLSGVPYDDFRQASVSSNTINYSNYTSEVRVKIPSWFTQSGVWT